MIQAFRDRVTVQPGGTIEVSHPELPAGASAEVIVMIESALASVPPLTDLIGKGKGCFASAEDVDAFIRRERDSWER